MATEQANDVRDELEALRARLAELEARVAPESGPDADALTRRRFFTAAGAAAAAGMAGAVLGSAPAGAATGNWDFGTSGNDATTDTTTLTSTNSSQTLSISNTGAGSAVGAVNTSTGHGLNGIASGASAFGVRAENSSVNGTAFQAAASQGTGITAVGGSATGFGVTAVNNAAGGTGVRGRSTQGGATSTGVLGEMTDGGSGAGFGVRGVTTDAVNAVGVQAEHNRTFGATVALRATVLSNTADTPIAIQGTATMNTGTGVSGTGKFGVKGASTVVGGIGVHGTSSAVTGGATAVLGEATGATGFGIGVKGASAGDTGVGVQGEPTHPTGAVMGVRGRTASTAGIGVSGETTAATGATVGVHGVASSTTGGIGVKAEGAFAPLRLVPAFSATGAPAAASHQRGEMYVDANGDLWLCTAVDDWTKLNDQAGGGGGGPVLNLLPLPFRVYDSRAGQPNPSGAPQGALAFGAASRVIDCTNTTPSLPASATAILFNLTVISPTGNFGALAVVSADAADPPSTVSSINWHLAGSVVGNNVTSLCNGSQAIKVKCIASAGCSANFSLDVAGYYE